MFSCGLRVLTLLGLAVSAAASVQGPLSFKSYDDGLFTPLGDLSLLSAAEFTSLGHPLFSNYKVRIKKSHFCDGTVR